MGGTAKVMPPAKVGAKAGGLAQILHALGVQMIDRENDIIDSIAPWLSAKRLGSSSDPLSPTNPARCRR
jgi:hypothetical protein